EVTANQERHRAEEAARRLAGALQEKQTQLDRAEFVAYAFRLREARQEIQRGQGEQARLILHTCNPNLSLWEHEYLLRLSIAPNQEPRALGGHGGVVRSLAFSPDGKRLASASDDMTVRVWNMRTGQETRSLKGHTKAVNDVAFSPDGKLLVSGGGDGL